MKWTDVLARAPLPMLALAAAYGVYQFNLLFVPAWVAFVAAAAFELTYIGLAFTSTEDKARAQRVAGAAVAVSVLYNTLAGWFHRAPDILLAPPWYADLMLAILHGAPLALIAYNISVLLLHQRSAPEAERSGLDGVSITVGRHTFTVEEWAQITGLSAGTIYRKADRYRAALVPPAEHATDDTVENAASG